MRLAGLGKCIWSWSEASGARFPFEISIRNTSKAEAAPKCVVPSLKKMHLGLPGTRAFAGLGTAMSARFIETRAKCIWGWSEAWGTRFRFGAWGPPAKLLLFLWSRPRNRPRTASQPALNPAGTLPEPIPEPPGTCRNPPRNGPALPQSAPNLISAEDPRAYSVGENTTPPDLPCIVRAFIILASKHKID